MRNVAAGDLVGRDRKRGHVGDVVSTGVIAIEEVEELGERVNLPAFADLDGAADAQIHLDVRRSAKFVEAGRLVVHGNAAAVVIGGNRERAGTFGLGESSQFETAGDVQRTGDHKAVANIFAGRAVVAGAEGIQRIANAVHVVEKFAEEASPGLLLCERVARGYAVAAGDIGLHAKHKGVVTGAVVRVKDVDARDDAFLVGHVREGNQRSEKIGAAAIAVPAVTMIALLVRVVCADRQVFIEGVLNAARNVDGVRRLVARADEVTDASGSANEAAVADERVVVLCAGEAARSCGCVRAIDRLKCSGPSALRQIVVEHAEAGANHRLLATTGRVDDSESRRDLLAVIVWRAWHQRNVQRLQSDIRVVLKLASARPLEEPEGGLITQAVVDRQVVRNSPGVLSVESESLNVLRKAAVAGGSE